MTEYVVVVSVAYKQTETHHTGEELFNCSECSKTKGHQPAFRFMISPCNKGFSQVLNCAIGDLKCSWMNTVVP